MVTKCPKCKSETIFPLKAGEEASQEIGSIIGAVGSVATVLKAVRFIPGNPIIGIAMCAVSAVLVAGFVGYNSGWSAGKVIGSTLDASMLNNYQCYECKAHFHIDEAI